MANEYHIGGSYLEGGQIKELRVSTGMGHYDIIRVFTEPDNAAAKTFTGRSVQAHGGCATLLNLARSWLDDCTAHHDECRLENIVMDPQLPTRVIDIGQYDKDIPYLLITNTTRGKWAALSHRWGVGTSSWRPKLFGRRSLMLKTTTKNISELQRGIPRNSMPATFLEAITVTRVLGLRYLWIDSLCILQDSDEDWARESELMLGVYKEAHVTIAAGATSNSMGGIFVDREWVKTSKAVHYPFICDAGEGSVSFDVEIDRPWNPEEGNFLASRAWCLQESYLSRRLLTFGREQMSYTCRRHILREEQDWTRATSINMRSEQPHQRCGPLNKGRYSTRFPGYPVAKTQSSSPALEKWYNLVTDYSSRSLTFQSDKLVAISGLAQTIAINNHNQYYAGIWHSSLPQALLWSPHNSHFPGGSMFGRHPYREYTAPSWSWASLSGKIWFDICSQTMTENTPCSVLEVSTTLQDRNPYGRVCDGFLKVRGPLRRGFCDATMRDISSRPWLFWHARKEPGQQVASVKLDAEHYLQELPEIWCLQITAVQGLILRRVAGKEEVYSRLGIFSREEWVMEWESPIWFSDEDVQTITII